jgi:hypothetical protein
METREVKIWNHVWNMEVTEYVRSIDGADLHDGHVQTLKDELYSAVSDLSKSATGSRMRYDISDMSVAELDELVEYWGEASERACEEEREREHDAMVRFEATVMNLIACGAGDRATAIRWIREGQDEFDRMYGDERLRWSYGLPWNYDFDHGDQLFFERQAAKAA